MLVLVLVFPSSKLSFNCFYSASSCNLFDAFVAVECFGEIYILPPDMLLKETLPMTGLPVEGV